MLPLLASLVVAALPADDYTAPRNATIQAAGATVVRVVGVAGALEITGRDGAATVEVRGTARASAREYLDEIRLETRRDGDVVEVRAVIPERRFVGVGRFLRALDLKVEVPAGARLEVTDGSGDVTIRHVGALELTDGSGDVRVEDVGPLRLKDGSGEVRVDRARGDVEIEDGSGNVTVQSVAGSVRLEDGSGELTARDVTGSVRVTRDGSGSIHVAGVGGGFTVERDGSGSIDYHDVKGAIDIPRPRHRRGG